ncbi:MAG TPA: right-handed parallel beta-helix repeat-containing protein [Methylomirabilota bacterium]|nr:right-handed parallel beta-helix repeat-containing protein [Methylomirabilota bacterium]
MESHSWIAVSVFVFVTLALALSLLIFQNTAFNVIPFPIEEAKAIKHKTSSASSSNEGNTIIPSSPSPQHPNTASHNDCINYNPSKRTITISCNSPARLTDIDNKLHDSSILAKQSPNGVWFLSANLVIAKGATFHIDSTDTKWLKISSKVTRTGVPKIAPAYTIDVHGSLKIDSVKITSWDPITNYYAITNGSRTGSGVFIFGAPRPSIIVENNATGTTDITNSEIAYLGYEQGKHKGGSGLSYYYGGDGSIIRNNDIHHVYFGLYTFGVGHMIIENNIIRNSGHYGLDPHTGTHDMIIRNNVVYDNNGSGIICSLNCYNILIENNRVHDNAENGIDFSRNMYNSIARNNIVYNEPSGIFVSQSHNNQIYNNTISKSGAGINVNSGSSNNKISGNTIDNSISQAILLNNGSSGNSFYSNKIISSTTPGLKINQDSTSKNNIFYNNQITRSSIGGNATADPNTEASDIKHKIRK